MVIDAPIGTSPEVPSSNVNESVCTGISSSLAVAVNVSNVSSSIDLEPIGSSTGFKFTSSTVIVIVSRSVSIPSETTTSNI